MGDRYALLLFGGTGSIGEAVRSRCQAAGWKVTIVSRSAAEQDMVAWDPGLQPDAKTLAHLEAEGPFDAVCWAHGANANDSVYDFDTERLDKMLKANCTSVLSSLHVLLKLQLLSKPARLCIVSSIWQTMARQQKLSYCVSKAAVQGAVLSLAADLGKDGHLVNAVLPGVIETPMTRANLKPGQIVAVEASTQFGRLATLEDVASTVRFLCSTDNTGVTAQFVRVDLGYSNVRII